MNIPSKDKIKSAVTGENWKVQGDEFVSEIKTDLLNELVLIGQMWLDGKLVEDKSGDGTYIKRLENQIAELKRQLHIAEENLLSVQMQYDKLMVRVNKGKLVVKDDVDAYCEERVKEATEHLVEPQQSFCEKCGKEPSHPQYCGECYGKLVEPVELHDQNTMCKVCERVEAMSDKGDKSLDK